MLQHLHYVNSFLSGLSLRNWDFFSSNSYWIVVVILSVGPLYFIKDVARIRYPDFEKPRDLAAKYGLDRALPVADLSHILDLEWKTTKTEKRKLLSAINTMFRGIKGDRNTSAYWATYRRIDELDLDAKHILTASFLPVLRTVFKEFRDLWDSVLGPVIVFLESKSHPVFTPYDTKLRISDTSATYNFLWMQMEAMKNIFRKWRQKESSSTALTIQSRMSKIQNPIDCSTARFLVCDLYRGCGLGCQLHYGLFCVAGAYELNRTLIVKLSKWQYTNKNWEEYFVPPSTSCQWTKLPETIPVWSSREPRHDEPVLMYPNDLYARPPWIPYRVPAALADRIATFHGKPRMWWIGQLMNNLWQIYPEMEEQLRKKMRTMEFKSPIVGIHIRRSDKIASEAKAYPLEQYMGYVEAYYEKLEMTQSIDQRRVFLASDYPGVFAEFRIKYSQYKLISNQAAASSSSRQNTRYTEQSLLGIIADVFFLSQTDHLVCTMSSNVCRLAYAILQTRFPDAGNYYDSLDLDYILFGGHFHHHEVRFNHTTKKSSEISLQAGDKIVVDTNFWNGSSQANVNAHSGSYPSYKVTDGIVEVF